MSDVAAATTARAQRRDRRRRRAQLSTAVAAFLAVATAMLPLLTVIDPGGWLVGAAVTAALVIAAGFGMRWRGSTAVATAVVQIIVWLGLCVAAYLPPLVAALLEGFHTPVPGMRGLIADALRQIADGSSPLPATPALSFLLVCGAGLLAVCTDLCVSTLGMPPAAVLPLLAVWIMAPLAVPADLSLPLFLPFAAAVLFLLRADTRTRHRPRRARPTRAGSTSLIAVTAGACTLLVAVLVVPLLPQPPAKAGFGTAGGTSISASLDLGRDLRRPRPVTVLTVMTDGDAPYLRVATLSDFTGTVWRRDATATVPLASPDALPTTGHADDIATSTQTTGIHVDALTARYLPVPYAAVSTSGVGGGWLAMPENRTIVGNGAQTRPGMDYTVVSKDATPTLEQIEATPTGLPDVGFAPDAAAQDYLSLPDDVPAVITRDARRVTENATNDYDKLVALQDWLRGPDFTYSLDAPRTDGYDGSGMSAIAAFLQARAGYCVHFASAFAVMARTLGIPARIVVGYLPGTAEAVTGAAADGPTRYTVSSSQLHSWVEVPFPGIGWVRFDPTKSLGEPTAFLPAATDDAPGVTKPETAPTEATPSPAASLPAHEFDPDTNAAPTPSTTVGRAALGWLWWPAGVVVLLLIPALLAAVRRRIRDAAARRGDVFAAWRSVQEAAVDVGLPVRSSDTPRTLGSRLISAGAAPDAVATLVDAVEHAAYAGEDAPGATASADAAREIRRGLRAALRPAARWRSILIPRSLVIVPGSDASAETVAADRR